MQKGDVMNQENEFTFIWDLPGKYLAFFGILLGMILPGFCLGMCYSVGMRKEPLREEKKLQILPLPTLYPTFLDHLFGKRYGIVRWLRKQTGRKGESDMKNY